MLADNSSYREGCAFMLDSHSAGMRWNPAPLIKGAIARMRAAATQQIDFRMLAEYSTDVVCLLGPDLRIRYMSPSARETFARDPAQMIGLLPDALILAEDLPAIAAAAGRLATGEERCARVTVRTMRPDGTLVWLESSARHLPGPHGATDTMLTIRDVTVRKALEEELATLARTDGLTGLANRRALTEALERGCRSGTTSTLVMLDVDRFKPYNDRFGHQAGDECLFLVAAALAEVATRHSGLAARYGGEEFAALFGEMDRSEALTIAEDMRSAVEGLGIEHPENSGLACVTASLGVAGRWCLAEGTADRLIRLADAALYRAKKDGRNRVQAGEALPVHRVAA